MSEEIVKKTGLDLLKSFLPINLNVWVIVLTCLVVMIALSRLMSLQKTVSEISSRPAVDEHVVRGIVRQHLEETVKAMDQQNRLQIQMRQQQLEQARRQVPPPAPSPPAPVIEIIEPHPVFEKPPTAAPIPSTPPPPPAIVAPPEEKKEEEKEEEKKEPEKKEPEKKEERSRKKRSLNLH
jgi:outer membrane biosynthesis protein TonB